MCFPAEYVRNPFSKEKDAHFSSIPGYGNIFIVMVLGQADMTDSSDSPSYRILVKWLNLSQRQLPHQKPKDLISEGIWALFAPGI